MVYNLQVTRCLTILCTRHVMYIPDRFSSKNVDCLGNENTVIKYVNIASVGIYKVHQVREKTLLSGFIVQCSP